MARQVIFSRDELDLIVSFAGCSLDEKPGSNWVQRAGGLPEYICEVARAVKRGGKTTSQAIAIAVSRMKKWAAGVGVDKDTQAKAAAALAEWEKLRAKSHAKAAAKKVKTTNTDHEVLYLANASEYCLDDVSSAFDARMRQARTDWRKANPNAGYDDGPTSMYVKEVWNTFVIVRSGYGRDADLYKIPYTVDENADVTFGEPVEVKTTYVVVDEADEPGSDISDDTLSKLMAAAGPCPKSAVTELLSLTADTSTGSAVARLLALAEDM